MALPRDRACTAAPSSTHALHTLHTQRSAHTHTHASPQRSHAIHKHSPQAVQPRTQSVGIGARADLAHTRRRTSFSSLTSPLRLSTKYGAPAGPAPAPADDIAAGHSGTTDTQQHRQHTHARRAARVCRPLPDTALTRTGDARADAWCRCNRPRQPTPTSASGGAATTSAHPTHYSTHTPRLSQLASGLAGANVVRATSACGWRCIYQRMRDRSNTIASVCREFLAFAHTILGARR